MDPGVEYSMARDKAAGGLNARARREVSAQLSDFGAVLEPTIDGALEGWLTVDAPSFPPIDRIQVPAQHAFTVERVGSLSFSEQSCFAALGEQSYGRFGTSVAFHQHLGQQWELLKIRTERALVAARRLSPKARVSIDPWRVEGVCSFGEDQLRLLFSSDGAQACVIELNDRPVVAVPPGRVRLSATPEEDPARWAEAIAQLEGCLGEPGPEAARRSVDITTHDLERPEGEHEEVRIIARTEIVPAYLLPAKPPPSPARIQLHTADITPLEPSQDLPMELPIEGAVELPIEGVAELPKEAAVELTNEEDFGLSSDDLPD